MSTLPLLIRSSSNNNNATNNDIEQDSASTTSSTSSSASLPLITSSRQSPTRKRHVGMDIFRGAIVMLMALDHTTHAFAASRERYPGAEAWQGPFSTYNDSWRVFIERAVSHVCAPGFFLTMGISITLFSISRTEHHAWSSARILRHFWVRGLVLCLIQPVVGLPAALPALVDVGVRGREWPTPKYEPGDEVEIVEHALVQWIQITTTLGLAMMFQSWLFFPLRWMEGKFRATWHGNGFLAFTVSFVIFILMQAMSNVVVVHAQYGDPTVSRKEFPGWLAVAHSFSDVLVRLLFLPGGLFKPWIVWTYPLMNWASMSVLGIGLGFVIKRNIADDDDVSMHRTLRVLSATFLIGFAFIRGLGGRVGNFRGPSRGDHFARSSIEFFAVTKYPPDLAFSLVTLGLDFFLLSFFSHAMFDGIEDVEEAEEEHFVKRMAKRACSLRGARDVFLVFGRVPFFFYVCHLWVINGFEALLRLPDPPSGRFRLEVVVVTWIVVLICMYPLCVRFHRFKESTPPESWWRVF
jgi:uncharacterized membrane protein